MCRTLFLSKVKEWKKTTLLKNRLRHMCFAVSFFETFKSIFFSEHLRWMLLNPILKPFSSLALCRYIFNSGLLILIHYSWLLENKTSKYGLLVAFK